MGAAGAAAKHVSGRKPRVPLALLSASAGRGEAGFGSAQKLSECHRRDGSGRAGISPPPRNFPSTPAESGSWSGGTGAALPPTGQADSLSGNRETEVSPRASSPLRCFPFSGRERRAGRGRHWPSRSPPLQDFGPVHGGIGPCREALPRAPRAGKSFSFDSPRCLRCKGKEGTEGGGGISGHLKEGSILLSPPPQAPRQPSLRATERKRAAAPIGAALPRGRGKRRSFSPNKPLVLWGRTRRGRRVSIMRPPPQISREGGCYTSQLGHFLFSAAGSSRDVDARLANRGTDRRR